MQKYYHRGAFFQDSDESVMKRDYNLPTAMELQDKTALPKILQKRRNDFGKKGQSKHTHLTDVDTTNFDPKTKAN
jgi:microfibrillar-associated protein 1